MADSGRERIIQDGNAEAGAFPVAKLMGISKYFPGVTANKGVELDIWPGEIHALVGENGAGKSTLMNILTGLYQPDEGEIIIDGYGQVFHSPEDAISQGIGMVHQHFHLVEAFSVAENIHLGWKETPGFLSASAMEARTRALAGQYGFPVNPHARIAELSAGEQQRVEILRVLSRKARLLIMDEPTAVLTSAETQDLFTALRALREQGVAIIIISHKLDEVLSLSDRVSILRGGQKIATHLTAECTQSMLATLMVGEEIARPVRSAVTGSSNLGEEEKRQKNDKSESPVLSLQEVTVLGDKKQGGKKKPLLSGISLDIFSGEILGIAGVVGNGQKELSEIMTGMLVPDKGNVFIRGQKVQAFTPAFFAAHGIGHIPEDRLHTAMAASLSVNDNLAIRQYGIKKGAGFGFYPNRVAAYARTLIDGARMSLKDGTARMGNLSGGNQQRLVALREVDIATDLLVAAYPNRGLDIKAISFMQQTIQGMKEKGIASVLFSEDIDEIMALADRIAVIFHGELMGVLPAGQVTRREIGLLMGGQSLSSSGQHIQGHISAPGVVLG